MKYVGEFVLLFVSDSKKVSVNKKQNQPASSLHVQASYKILLAESLGLEREGDTFFKQYQQEMTYAECDYISPVIRISCF